MNKDCVCIINRNNIMHFNVNSTFLNFPEQTRRDVNIHDQIESEFNYNQLNNIIFNIDNTIKILDFISSYWGNLVQLGYTQAKVGASITKEELSNYAKSTDFNIGDILVYWGNGNTESSPVKYGHTQMYTGGYAQKGQNWTSDLYTNYGKSFVYNSKPIDCWNLKIGRAHV